MGSSLSSSWVAPGSISIRHPMPFQELFEGHRVGAAGQDVLEAALGEEEVLEVVEVLDDRLPDVEALRSSGPAGEILQPRLDLGWKRRT